VFRGFCLYLFKFALKITGIKCDICGRKLPPQSTSVCPEIRTSSNPRMRGWGPGRALTETSTSLGKRTHATYCYMIMLRSYEIAILDISRTSQSSATIVFVKFLHFYKDQIHIFEISKKIRIFLYPHSQYLKKKVFFFRRDNEYFLRT
jgi:hypothetical protein